jgi:hypothetical protein
MMRMLQTVVAAMQSSGTTDGLLELPDGIVLPAKSLQELLDIEKLLETGDNLRRLVCTLMFHCLNFILFLIVMPYFYIICCFVF